MKKSALLMTSFVFFALSSTIHATKSTKGEVKKTAPATTASASVMPLKLELVKLSGAQGQDIVQVAIGSKDHTTLVTALKAADLVPTLTGPGPYTIFAPTNAAFEKLPKGTVESLLKPENKAKLRSILEHHAAAPSYSPNILFEMTELDMVDGPKLQVKTKEGKLFVDGVEILAALGTKNGIVYVVDTVLLPK